MLACTYAQHKQHDKAIENLKLAYQKGYKNYDALLSDPDLDVLKGNKDFQALLDKYVPDWRNH